MANIPISSFTAAANATGIGMSGFSLTGSNAQSMLDLAGTWNTSGTPTGLKLNVTDTASNAASLLMDLQVGGVSRFRVDKDGRGRFSTDVWLQSDATNRGLFFGSAGDTVLLRDAANTLAQRNGVNAQTSRIYNTYTDASNYERGGMQWSGGAFQVGVLGTAGTGSPTRSIQFLVNNGAHVWNFSTAGHFLAAADNAYDIGASGANRPRNVYAAGSIDAGSNVFAAGRIQAPKLRITDGITAPAATAGFAEIYVDAADGDLKIVFGDGTVKTIVTDT